MEKLAEGVQDAVQGVHDAVQGVHDGVRGVQAVCDWLDQVKKLDELINAKLAERTQLMDMATKITPEVSDMPHGGGVSDRVGTVAVKLADLARETDDLVDRYVDHRDLVIRTLEKLPPMEYGALHRHFIQYMTWEEVAADMGKSYMQVWRYKKKGLEKLASEIECYTIPVV